MLRVLLDTNLLLVLIVGRTNKSYLDIHKRTGEYDSSDYETLERLVAAYDGMATVQHVLAETSNLLRQIKNPARDLIQEQFRDFILSIEEVSASSAQGCRHEQYLSLGLTDAMVLAICEGASRAEDRIELLTADEPIYDRARSLGLPAELYA